MHIPGQNEIPVSFYFKGRGHSLPAMTSFFRKKDVRTQIQTLLTVEIQNRKYSTANTL